MIRLIYGENDFAVRAHVQGVKRGYKTKHCDQSVLEVQADQLTVTDLPQLLLGTSLFADDKLVVMHHLSGNKLVWERLSDFLDMHEICDLVLVDTKPDKRTRTYKWLMSHAELTECRLLDERSAVQWCQAEAEHQGFMLLPQVAAFLVEYCGTDQWLLQGAIAKLRLVNGDISIDSIRTYIVPHPSATVFALLDAMLSGHKAEALEVLGIVRTQEDPYKFMGLLASQLYTLALVVHSGGRSSQVIAKESGQHPFVIQKLSQLAKRMDASRVRALVSRTQACDQTIKSTGQDPWLVIGAMVGSM